MSKAAELAALIGSQTALSNRNLIINGAMQVNQRGTTFTGANATSGYIVDRFSWGTNNTGSFDVSSSTTSPVGFSNSIGISCTTAEASPTAGSYQNVIYRLEAQSIQQLNASSGTVAFTISFYVYSSKTGTYTIEARKMDSARHIAKEFTIDSANTWERKTISISADATGSIDNDNGSGIQLYFWLAGGTTYTSGTLATSWGAFDNANRVSSSNVNIGDSTSNTFYITGVQLEVGEQDTPFEHRSYGDELARCQRYYEYGRIVQTDTNVISGSFVVLKRAAPTMTRLGNTYTASEGGTFGAFDNSAYYVGSGGVSYVGGQWSADAEL